MDKYWGENAQLDDSEKFLRDYILNKVYYNLDFEDLIAGEIKTRFKYVDQVPESYGLSNT